jgi:hypothetical protein
MRSAPNSLEPHPRRPRTKGSECVKFMPIPRPIRTQIRTMTRNKLKERFPTIPDARLALGSFEGVAPLDPSSCRVGPPLFQALLVNPRRAAG